MQNLADFWKQNKKRIGEALSRGMDELAETLRTGAENFNLVQKAFGVRKIGPKWKVLLCGRKNTNYLTVSANSLRRRQGEGETFGQAESLV